MVRLHSSRQRSAGLVALLATIATLAVVLPGVALIAAPALLLFGVLVLGYTPGEELIDRLRRRRFVPHAARAPQTLTAHHLVVVPRTAWLAASALAMRPPPRALTPVT